MGLKPRATPQPTAAELIRTAALALPGAFERPSYGGWPSWRNPKRMFAWIRTDPEALVVWVASLDDKEAMIATEPERFFTIPHYDGYPVVLVRLEGLTRARAEELVRESYRLRSRR